MRDRVGGIRWVLGSRCWCFSCVGVGCFAVCCRRLGLAGGRGGGELINGDELILQHTEISRRLPTKFPLSPSFVFPFHFFFPSQTCLHPSPSYALRGFELPFPWNSMDRSHRRELSPGFRPRQETFIFP